MAAVLRRFVLFWLPLLFWMCVIFGASTGLGAPRNTSRFIVPILHWLNPGWPESTVAQIHFFIRKTSHAVEYAILATLVWRVIRHGSRADVWTAGRQAGVALLCSALYAASDETHQLFVPGREGSVRDVMIDSCGAAAGLAGSWGVLRWRARR